MGRGWRGDYAAVVAGAGFGGVEELPGADRGRARDAGGDVCGAGGGDGFGEGGCGRCGRADAAELRSARTGEAPVRTTCTRAPTQAGADTDFDPGNFSFDFAAHDAAEDEGRARTPVAPPTTGLMRVDDAVEGFRAPGAAANTAEILKFLIDRTGYIKQLEEEDTPEAYSRIENLRELVNAAMDSRDRGETLDQFLDHAALVSDADQYDEHAQITLMTLHAAKGLEFPLVVLAGMEEGLFPHSRTMLEPDSIEEERRLCYVGMTRAMDTLILSRAVYRRRYGTDMPEASVPSRFLEEVPPQLVEELGGSRRRASSVRLLVLLAGLSRAGVPAPHGQGGRTIPTKTKTRALPGTRRGSSRRRRLRSRATTPSTTLPSFLFRGARSSRFRKCRRRSPKAGADSVPGRRSSTRNMGKGRCISAKGMGKTPRLRYNFLASV